MPEDLRSLYFALPEPTDPQLLELARSYYRNTEIYDRHVCTGPMTRDGIMPATPRERALINRNAHRVMANVSDAAEQLGFSREQLRDAMKIADREPIDLESP
ncbi:hypothetical protein [Burkholderia sp. Ac-20349]|uniref:hypothetical protein n=1 Tax=Burkholderia sp. Ac-20349 TaxID=2703893 RepID=UPI00197BBA7A|nr:hypothetical protein [Burkholderia sp. Ac-20349]MBN3839346.1 hypothetical protein [Burkholderia sp. Ac-20349]